MRSRRQLVEVGESAREAAADLDRESSESQLARIIREGLEARGLEAVIAESLVSQLLEQAAGFSSQECEALLDGAVLACGVQFHHGEEYVRSAGQVREIERMMQAFSGELSKLDESLELLAAYVRRMRTPVRSSGRAPTILH